MNPNYDLLITEEFGGWPEGVGVPANAFGITVGSNPPYGISDFLTFYPQFGGTPLVLPGDVSAGSAVVHNIVTSGLISGLAVTSNALPLGAAIQSVDSGTQVTLSKLAVGTGTAVPLSLFTAPLIPVVVLNSFLSLASASLRQALWQGQWTFAMALYVAHFCTLYLLSAGNAGSAPGKVAAAGLARGIAVSKSAGPVSIGLQTTTGLDEWGSWTETQYGKQLITFAKVVGSGPRLVW